nr:DNA helicase [Tanacetum cinerariifolium]
MSGRDYANRNGDQSCEEECFDSMWPRIPNTTGEILLFLYVYCWCLVSFIRFSCVVSFFDTIDDNVFNIGHDMVDISVVHVSRIFDRFRNMGSNTLGSDSMSQAEDIPISEANVGKHEAPSTDVQQAVTDCSIQEDIPISKENVGTREAPSADVQILGNGRNVSTRLSTGGHDVVSTTMVLVSRIFDRFRNMRLNSVGSDNMSHTDILGHTASSSRMASVNHAYLSSAINDCSTLGTQRTQRTQNIRQSRPLKSRMYNQPSSSTNVPRRSLIRDEVANKIQNFEGQDEDTLNPEIVEGLIHALDEHNGLVRLFKTARDRCSAVEIPRFKIRLYDKGGIRGYELLTSDILGGIVFEDKPNSLTDFDVIIEFRDELVLKPRDGSGKGKKVSINAYYNKIRNVAEIDEYISAEIHDPVEDPRGYKVVTELMMHGPCGVANPSASCTEKGICNKYFPKRYNDNTFFDINGHTHYRRRQIEVHFMKGESRLDNCNVVPYNRMLCLAFHAHINVEYCGWSMLIKYHFKYISKVPDRIIAKTTMKDDISAKVSEATGILNYHVNTPELQRYSLYELEAILNGFGKSVKDFGLPLPPERLLKDLRNKLLMEERNYKRDLLIHDVVEFVPKLNHDQKEIYNLILNASKESRQELLFVYGHGWTGKTFLWKTIISSLRSQGKIVLAVASSGIASLLFPAGRTTHSRFKLPLNLTDESVCHAKKHRQLANLLIETDLIIWDEAPMNDRRCFEALDRTLRDLMDAPEIVFGGKTVICKLKENMRLLRPGLSNEERQRFEIFAKWLLDVGNGETGEPDEDNDEDSSWITVPQQYCLTPGEQGLLKLIDFIYDDATLKAPTASTLREKAIVYPKNNTTDTVNAKILSTVKSATKTYLSKDEAIPIGRETSETELLYPMEYLNTLTFPGFPPHELQLKVGSLIMLLRNVNLPGGLCNSTRMTVTSLIGNVVELTMWDDLAKQFKKDEIEQLPRPIIIAVSSCRVTKYRGSKKSTNSTQLFKYPNNVMLTHNGRRHRTDRHYTPCYNRIRQASRYNFKAIVTDATATSEFTFTEAGEKITGYPFSQLMEKFKATDKTQLPIEMVNTIGKKHIFQIQFSLSTQKGAERFIVNDVLDIKSAVEKRNTGLMINESTNKDKGVDTESSTSTTLTTKDSINEDKSIPELAAPASSRSNGIPVLAISL